MLDHCAIACRRVEGWDSSASSTAPLRKGSLFIPASVSREWALRSSNTLAKSVGYRANSLLRQYRPRSRTAALARTRCGLLISENPLRLSKPALSTQLDVHLRSQLHFELACEVLLLELLVLANVRRNHPLDLHTLQLDGCCCRSRAT